jgi:hypothetical protein
MDSDVIAAAERLTPPSPCHLISEAAFDIAGLLETLPHSAKLSII